LQNEYSELSKIRAVVRNSLCLTYSPINLRSNDYEHVNTLIDYAMIHAVKL